MTVKANPSRRNLLRVTSLAALFGFAVLERPRVAKADQTPSSNQTAQAVQPSPMNSTTTLSPQQKAIIPITAFAAAGNASKLNAALENGLNAGLTISEVKELLVQVYAYAGFPRSLNALGELMKVLQARSERGITDAPGLEPSHAAPQGEALLEAGTRNQTELVGAPVKGPLFSFSPTIDLFLKTHLFGDIFSRDNVNWQTREIATISMLSAIEGVGSQLQSHLGVSMHVGISEAQIQAFINVLSDAVDEASAVRAREAMTRLLAAKKTA